MVGRRRCKERHCLFCDQVVDSGFSYKSGLFLLHDGYGCCTCRIHIVCLSLSCWDRKKSSYFRVVKTKRSKAIALISVTEDPIYTGMLHWTNCSTYCICQTETVASATDRRPED